AGRLNGRDLLLDLVDRLLKRQAMEGGGHGIKDQESVSFFESACGSADWRTSVLFRSSPQPAGPEVDCKLASRAPRAQPRSSIGAAGPGSLITFFARVPQTQLSRRGPGLPAAAVRFADAW